MTKENIRCRLQLLLASRRCEDHRHYDGMLTVAYRPWAKYEPPTPPPSPLGIFEDSDFWTPCYMTIQYLLVCTQNIGA